MGAGWSPPPIEPERGRLGRYLALPWRRFEIDTHLTPGQCAHALRAIVEPRRRFRWPIGPRLNNFEGEVTPEGFSITRIIRYRNSFLPMISGGFRDQSGGTHVTMRMRPHWFSLGFWMIWMAACVAIAAIVQFIAADAQRLTVSAFLAAMFVFGYLLCTVSFGIEAEKARLLLTDALTGRPPPTGH
jgi:hypothetical protein